MINCHQSGQEIPMKHYVVSISNLKGTGENDPASMERFLIRVNDVSLDMSPPLKDAVEEILKKKAPRFSEPIKWSTERTEIEGDIAEVGALVITDARFEVREMK